MGEQVLLLLDDQRAGCAVRSTRELCTDGELPIRSPVVPSFEWDEQVHLNRLKLMLGTVGTPSDCIIAGRAHACQQYLILLPSKTF